jgi:hypothetical protein
MRRGRAWGFEKLRKTQKDHMAGTGRHGWGWRWEKWKSSYYEGFAKDLRL